MPKPVSTTRPIRVTRRLLLIFVFTIVVPGAVLAVLGFRALAEERKNAESEVRARLDAAAESVGRRVELELKDWRQAADEIALSGSSDPAHWPERVRALLKQPGAGVVLLGSRDQPKAVPADRLSYELSPPIAAVAEPSVLLDEAKSFELSGNDYARAVAAYQQALESVRSGERVPALHGLARTLAKAGRVDEAIAAYRLLQRAPPLLAGSVPSDFLALDQIASLEDEAQRAEDALTLYRGLVTGRWRMDHVMYDSAILRAQSWIPKTEETARLAAEEERKAALSAAAERFVASAQSLLPVDAGTTMLAFWRAEPPAAIVVRSDMLRESLALSGDPAEFDAALLSPDGRTLLGAAGPEDSIQSTYPLVNAEFPLRTRVWMKDPAAFYAGVHRRQLRYFAMAAALVALLAFGGYFTARTLRGELDIAQMKSDFVSMVSHEFRTPLAGIHQLGEMLVDGRVAGDPARQRQYYGLIVTETQRLRRLVENVLHIASLDDRKQYRFEPVEPAAWLREVTEDFQTQLGAKEFIVETRIPERLPEIVGDRETLTTAMNNLLDNAVKYSPGGAAVRVEAATEDDWVAISVCDRGVGISAEDRKRIFDKFYRGGGDLARQVKGVGLGLNLVQRIVAAHGGTIDVDSTLGEGSRFTIRLRVAVDGGGST